MIRVTRLDGSELYLNADFIQSVESNPDTHIVLVNGQSYIVTETDDDVAEAILQYRRSVYSAGRGTSAYGRAVSGHLNVVEG